MLGATHYLWSIYLPREDHSQNNYNKTMNGMLEKIYWVVQKCLPKTVY